MLEKLIAVINSIREEADKLPVGFDESNVGENLPETRGWRLDVYRSGEFIFCKWNNGKSWGYGREEIDVSTDKYSIEKFKENEAAAIALIKAAPKLVEWLRSAASEYCL
jgi:hypothetical protein